MVSSLAPRGIAQDGRREAVRPSAPDRAGTPHCGPLLHVRKQGAFSGARERLHRPRPVHPLRVIREKQMPSIVSASPMRNLGTLAAFAFFAAASNGASFAKAKGVTASGTACHRLDTARCRRLSLLDSRRVNPPDRARPMAGLSCPHRNSKHPLCREIVVILK